MTASSVISTTPQAGPLGSSSQREALIWRSVGDLLVSAEVDGVLANKMGPLAARVMRERGLPVAQQLASEARLSRAAWIAAVPLLTRLGSLCEEPLLLIKGPEAAAVYPGRARAFMDLDLLCPDAESAHATLRANGFVEVDDPDKYVEEQHHLRPVQTPELWLWVEIHVRPPWPDGLRPPPMEEIVAAAVPSATGVPGILAPHPAHHALILASHAWVTQPLETLRDLVDVAAVAAQADEEEIAAVAHAWEMERIWRTTHEAASGLLGGNRQTSAVRVWGRHLPAVRERSVIGNHVGRWLSAFWGFPPLEALRSTLSTARMELMPYPGETWREKLIRVRHAVRSPRSPMSTHKAGWQDEAQRDA